MKIDLPIGARGRALAYAFSALVLVELVASLLFSTFFVVLVGVEGSVPITDLVEIFTASTIGMLRLVMFIEVARYPFFDVGLVAFTGVSYLVAIVLLWVGSRRLEIATVSDVDDRLRGLVS